jgi:hypothetical protein
LKWCGHKPTKPVTTQNQESKASMQHSSVDPMILYLWPAELWENRFLLF